MTSRSGIPRGWAALAAALLLAAGVLVGSAAAATPASAAGTPQLTASASPTVVPYLGSAVVAGVLTDDDGGIQAAGLGLFSRPAGTTGDWVAAGALWLYARVPVGTHVLNLR
jgi:hypothetical protein